MPLSLSELEAMRGAGRVPYLPIEKWRELDEAGQSEHGLYKSVADCEAKAADDAGGGSVLSIVASTGQVDRDKDTLSPAGWDVKAFSKNGVILFAHDQRSLPIGMARKVEKNVDGKLMVTAEFTPEDLNPLGDRVFRMIKARFLRAVSVGFLPTKHKQPDESEGRGFGVDFLKQELLEVSVVPVPSNPGSFAAAKAAGIDMGPMAGWAESVLDYAKGPGGWMTRENVERVWGEITKHKTTVDFGRPSAGGTTVDNHPRIGPFRRTDNPDGDIDDTTIMAGLSDSDIVKIATAVTTSLQGARDAGELDKFFAAQGIVPELVSEDFLGLLKAYNANNDKESEQ